MDPKRKYREFCKGCWLKDIAFHNCSFLIADITAKCPCGDCLVKMMCSSSCDKREIIFSKEIIEDDT